MDSIKIETEIDITKPLFNLTIDESTLRRMNRKQYHQAMSWLRSVRGELWIALK